MQLEDEFGDVAGKARRGREITVAELSEQVGISTGDVERIESYELTPPDDAIDAIANYLGLDPVKLRSAAAKRFFPLYPSGRPVEGLVLEMLVLGSDFLMNGYVLGCRETGKGVVVDPGFDPEKILKAVEAAELEIEQVLLTHGHGDHTGALSEVCQATGAPARINPADLLGRLDTKIEGEITDGEVIEVGNQRFTVVATPGHTPGGISMVHENVALVGDALFAGSLGGTQRLDDYETQYHAVAEGLLALDEKVQLFPGHGPATTVGEERANNPFFT
jgi:glyoxylase-like metal-dependent hydrolase (beta-lactamase superfamily II)